MFAWETLYEVVVLSTGKKYFLDLLTRYNGLICLNEPVITALSEHKGCQIKRSISPGKELIAISQRVIVDDEDKLPSYELWTETPDMKSYKAMTTKEEVFAYLGLI